ncbi:MAG: lipoyl synthase [Syntrophales bacterium]|nr:lipoyl synthase [Syntrophales bacterium]
MPVHQRYKTKKNTARDFLRKPDWLKVRLPNTPDFNRVRGILSRYGLHTICQEARCPNMSECFQDGTATFLILGSICTRNCRYCHVAHGVPAPVDAEEAGRLVFAVKSLSLKYVVITSVTRDDLPDGGAGAFARSIGALRESRPDIRIEVLIPDFQGQVAALEEVIAAKPAVINHNIEVAPSLYAQLRPEGNYETSLKILNRVGRAPSIISKSGFMIGFGENSEDISRLLDDLAGAGCQAVTIGQYLQPTRDHWPVRKYYHPDEFADIRETALAMGFRHVEAGPLVRSSYHAALSGSGGA